MPRYGPAYGATSNYGDGYQSKYTAGLTYFPDNMTSPQPLGDYIDDAAFAGGTAIAGPIGGTVAVATTNVIQRWFGGSAVDQQRQDRVNYVAQQAVNGNVNAMRLIIGAPDNVSGNEQQMWRTAYDIIKRENPQVVAAAEAIGPYWMPGSGDTATSYPRMREYIRQGQSVTQRVVDTVTDYFQTPTPSTSGGAPGSSSPAARAAAGISPVLLVGGAALAYVLFARRRS